MRRRSSLRLPAAVRSHHHAENEQLQKGRCRQGCRRYTGKSPPSPDKVGTGSEDGYRGKKSGMKPPLHSRAVGAPEVSGQVPPSATEARRCRPLQEGAAPGERGARPKTWRSRKSRSSSPSGEISGRWKELHESATATAGPSPPCAKKRGWVRDDRLKGCATAGGRRRRWADRCAAQPPPQSR